MCVYQYQLHKTLTAARIDLVKVCSELNPYVLPQYAGQALLTLLMLLTGNWKAFALNIPLLSYHAWEFHKKIYLFSPNNVAPLKGHSQGKISVQWRLIGTIAFYAFTELYYAYRLFY